MGGGEGPNDLPPLVLYFQNHLSLLRVKATLDVICMIILKPKR